MQQDLNMVFDHVHLISEDPQGAAAWYAVKLGGEISSSAEVLGAPQVRVAFEGATIIIRGRRPGEDPGKKQGFQWGVDHVGFLVPGDFDAFCDRLRQKGVTFALDPTDFSPGVRIAYIEAPDGVSIELVHREA